MELIMGVKNRAIADVIWRMLTRIRVPRGQRQLYKALYDVGDRGATIGDLSARMGRPLNVLGALGLRINKTSGIEQTGREGISLLLNVQKLPDGQLHYRLLPETREALEKLDPP
jgi:hypothetical protein